MSAETARAGRVEKRNVSSHEEISTALQLGETGGMKCWKAMIIIIMTLLVTSTINDRAGAKRQETEYDQGSALVCFGSRRPASSGQEWNLEIRYLSEEM